MSLTEKRSVHKATKLDPGQIEALLVEVPGYKADDKRLLISREYAFPDFYETIAFVNALAYIANQEDHHPDLAVSYNKCKVSFSNSRRRWANRKMTSSAPHVNALIRA